MNKIFVAMKAFIIDEENDTIFLMKKGTKDKLNPNKWEVPGGKMEFLESPTDTFIREVKEESGLDIEVGDTILQPWQWVFKDNALNDIQIIAVGKICRALSKEVDYSNQTKTDDLIESDWVPIKDVLNYDLIPNLVPTMKKFVEVYFEIKKKGEQVFKKGTKEDIFGYVVDDDSTINRHK